ncbi:MAG TPA: FAD-binding oxidoreductase [Pyrinomonadaceae bacterium]|nr:FAD-binding oxidoreductase [Pyrinomonadaceae bacterium]
MQVKTQLEDIQNYLTDASNMPGGVAERLFVPENEADVAAILRDANEQGVSVTISGARTGTVGGAVPFGGWVVSMERLKSLNVDRQNKRATVGAGVILSDLQKAVAAEGLFYPPDPTEWSCQIGGTVATNASGARSFKYGATRDFVERLRLVLADGDIVEIRRGQFVDDGETLSIVTESGRENEFKLPTYERPNVRKNVSGLFNSRPFDAIDLFIGSEGTLGVVTEIELRLLEKPEGFFSGVVFFDNESDLLTFVDEAKELSFSNFRSEISDSFGASLIEYFDSNALKFISEKFPETPANMAGAIFFEQETTASNEDELLSAWSELLEKHSAAVDASWFTTTDQDREKLRAFRHALPVSVNERVVRNKMKKIGTDMAVPDANFASFLKFYKETLDASSIDYVIFGHIGDCHLHANLLPKDETDAEKARHIYGRCVAQSIMLGGCVSAEHGIGKLKRKYLNAMMGERYLNEMADIKRAFDPSGTLGRGNIFDES